MSCVWPNSADMQDSETNKSQLHMCFPKSLETTQPVSRILQQQKQPWLKVDSPVLSESCSPQIYQEESTDYNTFLSQIHNSDNNK